MVHKKRGWQLALFSDLISWLTPGVIKTTNFRVVATFLKDWPNTRAPSE